MKTGQAGKDVRMFLSDELLQQVEETARLQNRQPGELISEAVHKYLADKRWLEEAVGKYLEDQRVG